MLGNRRRDTGPEVVVRRLLHGAGKRYRVDFPMPGARRRRIDIAFTRARVAVFVDGCFWHGCPEHYTVPRRNALYWAEKVQRNQRRDRDTETTLTAAGWRVLRFWEHEAPEQVVAAVLDALARPAAAP